MTICATSGWCGNLKGFATVENLKKNVFDLIILVASASAAAEDVAFASTMASLALFVGPFGGWIGKGILPKTGVDGLVFPFLAADGDSGPPFALAITKLLPKFSYQQQQLPTRSSFHSICVFSSEMTSLVNEDNFQGQLIELVDI